MQISRITSPVPGFIIDGFLPDADAARCLQECIALKDAYRPDMVDRICRRFDVAVLDQGSEILTLLDKQIDAPECQALWREGNLFDTINSRTWNECVVSRFGNDHFHRQHRDSIYDPNGPDQAARRLVTLTLFLHSEPEGFTGGGLMLSRGRTNRIRIAPRPNRAVVFPANALHEVEMVSLPDNSPWSDGLFSIDRWMGYRDGHSRETQ